eukprot:sb/3472586/
MNLLTDLSEEALIESYRQLFKLLTLSFPHQIESYRQLFKLFDRNNDGSISVDELGHVFRIHLGKSLSTSDLNKIIEEVDTNNSKTIEFDEFLGLMASETWSEIEKGEIIKAFAVFDRNKDGYVDAEELRYALCTHKICDFGNKFFPWNALQSPPSFALPRHPL